MAKPESAAAANYAEPDFSVYLEKAPTATQEHFHEWILDKTGLDPATFKTKALAFAEGVRIGTALRGIHQASPENQERLAEAREASAAAKAEKESAPKPAKAGPAVAPAKAAPAKTAAKAAPAKKAAPAAEAAPVKATRAPAKKAGGRRPAAAVVVVETGDDDPAPF